MLISKFLCLLVGNSTFLIKISFVAYDNKTIVVYIINKIVDPSIHVQKTLPINHRVNQQDSLRLLIPLPRYGSIFFLPCCIPNEKINFFAVNNLFLGLVITTQSRCYVNRGFVVRIQIK